MVVLIANNIFGQDEKKFGIKFSGFVKNDVFFDTRQTIAAREGHFLLFPAAEELDADGNDIKAVSNLNILAVQSRLSGSITGPDAFGAKTTGKIEGDFFAQDNANINLFRMRHAFAKLAWENTSLLMGQTWNPMFVTDCFPGVLSFNTGTPIQPFARNPQVRLTHNLGNLKIIVAALAQRDYTTRGPAGATSSYLRNSGMPDMHFQLHYKKENEDGMSLVTGVGGAYKTIVPQLSTSAGYATDESVSSMSGLFFLKLKTSAITFKAEAIYGENIADVLSISGYAVSDSLDPAKGTVKYSPFHNIAGWGEIHTNGDKLQVGIFGGYTKNLGTKAPIKGTAYGLGTDIENLFRVSPRVVFISGKTKLGFEVEHTAAAYGDGTTDENAVPQNLTTVANTRFLFTIIYSF